MPRDECRDCGKPAGEGADERDGRCPACHEAFLGRQPEPAEETPAAEPATTEEPEAAEGG